MKLAYSTNAFTRTDLHSALHTIADLGYAGAEILCDRPHWFPGEVTDAEVDTVAALIDQRGLGISNLNANTANGYYRPSPPENVFEPALTNPDPELRQWRERYTIEALRLAKRLGAPCISVTSGRPTPGVLPEQAIEWMVEGLKRICDTADRLDLKVAIEYEPSLLVERANELLDLMRRVDAPNLGANLDIGHAHLIGDTADTVAALAGRIWNVHVEDIKGRTHFHLVPGEGDLPFGEYLQALRNADYSGYLTVELYSYPDQPREVGARSLDYLSRLLDK